MESATVDSLQVLPDRRRAPLLHAGFWRRVAAWFIDCLILCAIQVVFTLSFGTWLLLPWAFFVGGHGDAMARIIDIALQPFGIVVIWLYYAVCESSRWQATPGKLALGLAVTDEYGSRIGFARASGRCFGMYVSALILCVGFLLAGWTARKQALHDLLAGCCVVRAGGLMAWRHEEALRADSTSAMGLPSRAVPVPIGMPGWSIALIVIAGGVFVVIPVLALLAAVAVPAYRSYTVRAEVAQGVELTERPRALIAEYIGARGALPESNADLGLPRPDAIQTRYVTSIRVADGKVVVTYGNQASPAIRGGHVVIAPEGNAKLLHWQCSSPDIRDWYLPSQCRP